MLWLMLSERSAELGRAFAVRTAQFGEFRVFLKVLGGGVHARHRIDHLMYTGESEVDHRGFGDVDAGTAETGLRLGQREALGGTGRAISSPTS